VITPDRPTRDVADLLERLVAERDIVARLYVYCEAADAETPEAFLDCFTPGGVFTHTAHGQSQPMLSLNGAAELERWFIERLPVVPPGTMSHTTVHPRVQVEGRRADATSQFVSIRAREEGLFVASTGSYRDVLVRCDDGEWRFAERHSLADMPRPR
jgi:SnoaL-like domain